MPDDLSGATLGKQPGSGWSLAEGETLGGYRVVKPLGRGGMGEVHLVGGLDFGAAAMCQERGAAMRRSSKYVGVALVAGALVLGCSKAGKRNVSSQKGQDGNAAASPTLTLDCGGGVTMELVLIPAGEFMMGSPANEAKRGSDESQHRVRITRAFYMGKYEVTQAEYQVVMGTNPSKFKGASNPVEQVSWNDSTEFCRKLSERSGKQVRLPTEAEWEYACRAGTTTPFHYGSSLGSDQANFDGNFPDGGAARGTYREKTTPVGSFQANAWGLHDMHGNVWEWCGDWYDEGYYGKSPGQNPTGPTSGGYRVLRGGAWSNFGLSCRSALRSGLIPSDRNDHIGFRVVAFPSPGR